MGCLYQAVASIYDFSGYGDIVVRSDTELGDRCPLSDFQAVSGGDQVHLPLEFGGILLPGAQFALCVYCDTVGEFT